MSTNNRQTRDVNIENSYTSKSYHSGDYNFKNQKYNQKNQNHNNQPNSHNSSQYNSQKYNNNNGASRSINNSTNNNNNNTNSSNLPANNNSMNNNNSSSSMNIQHQRTNNSNNRQQHQSIVHNNGHNNRFNNQSSSMDGRNYKKYTSQAGIGTGHSSDNDTKTSSKTFGDENANQGILHTDILHVQNKRYYFDIKEHEYGRFLKLAELGTTGKKSRMVIPVYLIPEFEKIFDECLGEYEKLPQIVRSDRGGSGDHTSTSQSVAATEYYSKILERGRRKYYFNLKENSRGRYIRVKAIGDIPQTFPGVRRRLSSTDAARAIVLPATGMANFRNVLSGLFEKWGVDESNDKVAASDKLYEEYGKEHDKFMKSERITCRDFKKIIFLDAGQNSRGTFARLTEQQRSRRESTTIPSLYFKKVGEWFITAAEKLPEEEKLSNKVAELNLQKREEERNASGGQSSSNNQTSSDSHDPDREPIPSLAKLAIKSIETEKPADGPAEEIQNGNANFRRENASDSE